MRKPNTKTAKKPKGSRRSAKPKKAPMTNGDLFRLLAGLQVAGVHSGPPFALAVARNTRRVRALCQDLEKAKAPSKEYIAFDQERVELAIKHASKDEAGQPMMSEDGKNYVIEKLASFTMALHALRDEYKEAIAEHDAKMVEYAKLLGEEAEPVKFLMISESDIPKAATGEQLDNIYEVIEE